MLVLFSQQLHATLHGHQVVPDRVPLVVRRLGRFRAATGRRPVGVRHAAAAQIDGGFGGRRPIVVVLVNARTERQLFVVDLVDSHLAVFLAVHEHFRLRRVLVETDQRFQQFSVLEVKKKIGRLKNIRKF